MRRSIPALWLALLAAPALADVPRFEAREIDAHAGEVCYALAVADVDGDGRADVVAATGEALLWYANPSWKRATIARGDPAGQRVPPGRRPRRRRPGRFRRGVGLGADGPAGDRGPGLGPPARRLGPVAVRHGRPRAVVASGEARRRAGHREAAGDRGPPPRTGGEGAGLGRGAGREGRGARACPTHPGPAPWPREVADEGLHAAHGLQVADLDGDGRDDLLVAAWEGVFALRRDRAGRWSRDEDRRRRPPRRPVEGGRRGPIGKLAGGRKYVATVEPWHGHMVVVYTPPNAGDGPWGRRVIDDQVAGGTPFGAPTSTATAPTN